MLKYITIEREYGSGGRAVARELAKACGIHCYGREILETAAGSLHIPVCQLEKYEENTTNSFLYSVNLIAKAQAAEPDMLMREGHLFVAEQMAIQQLASHGRAVFLGHCASEALKNYKGVLKVFIHSNLEDRRRRIVGEYGIAPSEVDSTIKRFDRKRAGYYSVNTAKKWHDFNNYDIVLDSSALGVEGCAAALQALVMLESK